MRRQRSGTRSGGCAWRKHRTRKEQNRKKQPKSFSDQEKADEVAALIDAIYVQKRTDETDAQCTAAKEAWDALTDAQKELVEGENADPDYFGRDTGDASKDDPLNQDEIGENEILVVSFGTSFNDSRVEDIGGIEGALMTAIRDGLSGERSLRRSSSTCAGQRRRAYRQYGSGSGACGGQRSEKSCGAAHAFDARRRV